MEKKIMFCLPYAGGSATAAYTKWKTCIDTTINVVPVELAGRGERYNEAFYNNFEDAVDDVYKKIYKYAVTQKYSLFGHSMGSWLAAGLLHKISQDGIPFPEHVFLSGNKAPTNEIIGRILHNLPNNELISEVKKIGGTSDEFFENKELVDIYLPILRADFKIIETARVLRPKHPYPVNATVFSGINDKYTRKDLLKWQQYFIPDINIVFFDGDHFFINNCMEQVLQNINDELLQDVDNLNIKKDRVVV